ncbi:MAG TPA: BON domain-containing protein [Thermoanaerobaculia bacterium]|nr:BON domain-containing protein [Thermoanaerobaculia bacterium]
MRKRIPGILGVAAAVVLVAFVAGCTTTQTPGEQIDDAAISTAVKAKLTEARFSNIVNVETNVTNGIVTLAGEVPNAQVKADAEAAVRSVKGVKGVNNNLQVKSPPTP